MRLLLFRFTGLIICIGFYLWITGKGWVNLPFQNQPAVKGIVQTASPLPVSQDVPEMAEILAPDQETRLKAGRKLAERVGVEAALEILEHSPLPHTGEGHLVVHQVGFYAYQKYGTGSILKCKDYFLFACYHGVIIEAATDQGTDGITKLTDKCKDASTRYFQCTHAAGHAILALLSYDLSAALKLCDRLYEGETQFSDALSSCHNGAFMENLFGVHDWGTGKSPVRDWLKDDDPYFPCTAFAEKYQRGCWLNQAARIYQLYQGDVAKTAAACEKIGNRQYVEWCFDNLARQLHPLTNGDTGKVFELCKKLGSYWEQGCIIVNAGAYYSVGDRQAPFIICGQLSPPTGSICFEKIMGQIIGDTIATGEKLKLCAQLPDMYKNTCQAALKNPT